MAGSFPHLRGCGVARKSPSLSSISSVSLSGVRGRENDRVDEEDIDSYLSAFRKRTKNKGNIDWAKLMESPPPLVSDVMGGASKDHTLPKDHAFLKPSQSHTSGRSLNKSTPVDSSVDQLSGWPPTQGIAGSSRSKAPSVAASHHLILRSSEMLSVAPSVLSLNTTSLNTVSTCDVKASLETEKGDSDAEDANGFLNVKMADEFLLTSDEEEGVLVPTATVRTLDIRGVEITQPFKRGQSDRASSREQSPSPTPSPPTVSNTMDEASQSLSQHLKEHTHFVQHLELAGSPSSGQAARGEVRDGDIPGTKVEMELDSPEITITESPSMSTSLPRFPSLHIHTVDELGVLPSSEGSQTPPGQQDECSDIALTHSTHSASHHCELRAVSPQTTRGRRFNFSAGIKTVSVDLQSASKIQQPRFESVLSHSHGEDVTGYSDDYFEPEAVTDENTGESTRESEVMEELSDEETHEKGKEEKAGEEKEDGEEGEEEEEMGKTEKEGEEEETEKEGKEEREEKTKEEGEGKEQGEDKDQSVSTSSIEVDVTGHSRSPYPSAGDSDTESMAHEHSSIQYPQILAHSTSSRPHSFSPTDKVCRTETAASKGRGTSLAVGQTVASKAGRTGTAKEEMLGSQDASVQSTLPDMLESVGGHFGSRDPTPIAPHAVSQEALAYTPAMIALNDMLRAQLLLTKQFITSTRRITESLSVSLQPDHHYTTLEDTKELFSAAVEKAGKPGNEATAATSLPSRHRPKVLTREEAKELVRRREERKT